MEDHVDDDLTRAVVRPLIDDDPELAARLAARFTAALAAAADGLSPGERDYLNDYRPVKIEAGSTPGGQRVLRFRFAGTTSTYEWDGSEPDANGVIDGLAENAVSNVQGDFWVHGRGWEQWNKTQGAP